MKKTTLDKIIEEYFNVELKNRKLIIYVKGNFFNLLNLGTFFCKFNEHKQVINTFKKALKIDKTNTDILATLGDAYCYVNNYRKSKKMCRKALKVEKSNIEILTLLAETYYDFKKYNKSIKVNKKVLKLSSNNVHIWYRLGTIYEIKGDLELAHKSYLKALSCKPNDAIILITLRRIRKEKIFSITGVFY